MSKSESAKPTVKEDFFMLKKNEGGFSLDNGSMADELLHPAENKAFSGDSLSETQYFSISVPEENIHGLIYCWHRPNLKIVTGGVWIWQGVKKSHLTSELFDFKTYMNDSVLANDLYKYRFENGLGVEVIEPAKCFHVTYADDARGNALDLHYVAATPLVKFGDGAHFEQGMRVEGELKLRGKSYQVKCFNVRDRTWASMRSEISQPIPPVSWMTCAFSEDFYFGIIAYDHPELHPDWAGIFDFPAEKVLKSGWIYRDGELLEVVSCRKLTTHDGASLFPTEVRLEITDNKGKTYHIKGTAMAASNWSAWLNCDVVISLYRWECDGLVGHGDLQEARWTDYLYALSRRQVTL